MRSRAVRRHHRSRLIKRRSRDALAASVMHSPGKHPEGALADNQYWLGCNLPNCGLCHPWKRWSRSADRHRAKISLHEEI